MKPPKSIQSVLQDIRSAKDSKSRRRARTTSKSATSTGIDPTPEKVIAEQFSKLNLPERVVVEPDLGATRAFWWFLVQLQKFDLSLLDQLELTSEAPAAQAITGSVLEFSREDESLFYHLRGRVVGPFPSIQIHGFGSVTLENVDDGIIWILSHELCHFLKRTKQLKGKNDERSACKFADEWLEAFRRADQLSEREPSTSELDARS